MGDEDSSLTELEKRLRVHSTHFASRVELIPAKYYIMRDDNGDQMFDSKYWINKSNSKTPKQSVKEATKKAKRLKFDPDSHRTIGEMQAEVVENEKERHKSSSDSDNDDASEEETSGTKVAVDADPAIRLRDGFTVERVRSTNLNDLRERLTRKIQELHSKRERGDDFAQSSEVVVQKRQKTMEKRQRRKEFRLKEKKKKLGKSTVVQKSRQDASESTARPSIKDETGRVVFSKFDFSTSSAARSEIPGSSKTGSKKDYRTLLAKAEIAQKKLEEIKKKDEKRGEELQEKLQWQRALDLARGSKLKDDPKLLKKTVKRLEKRKNKSGKEWEQRMKQEQQAREKIQEKRKTHIQDRVEKIKAKKMKKSSKRKGRKPGF